MRHDTPDAFDTASTPAGASLCERSTARLLPRTDHARVSIRYQARRHDDSTRIRCAEVTSDSISRRTSSTRLPGRSAVARCWTADLFARRLKLTSISAVAEPGG
jgi:hypothetical protein